MSISAIRNAYCKGIYFIKYKEIMVEKRLDEKIPLV